MLGPKVRRCIRCGTVRKRARFPFWSFVGYVEDSFFMGLASVGFCCLTRLEAEQLRVSIPMGLQRQFAKESMEIWGRFAKKERLPPEGPIIIDYTIEKISPEGT